MKISVSWLSAYLFCPRKLYLEQVLGLKALPADVTVKGTIKHNVLDLVNKQEKGIVTSLNKENIKEVNEKYISFYSKNLINSIRIQKNILDKHNIDMMNLYNEMWTFFKKDAEMRASYVTDFVSKFNIYGNELWESLTPKILTEIYVESEILELKGKIDRIEQYQDKYIPVEIKTGRAPRDGVWEGHLIQIGAYMMLMEEHFGVPVNEGKIHYLESGERVVKMNPFLREGIIRLKDEVKALLNQKELPDFINNENKCNRCPLKEQCYGL